MNVNETLKKMFSDLLPVAADTYKGKATEYIVFNYTAIPEDFGDDDAQHWRYLTQVHLYAPHEKNSLAYRREITRRLVAGGFTRPTITPASDETGQHYVLNARFPGALTMAELSTQGLDGLIDDMTALMELPDETVLEMLTAEAEVVAAAQQSEAQSMGVYATGKTAGSISYDKKLKVKGASRAIYVSPKGTRSDGNKRRNAEVAFVNEYGKAGQPARPFINTANEKSADAAVEAAAGVYDKYLKSKNL